MFATKVGYDSIYQNVRSDSVLLVNLIKEIKRRPVQRDTFFNIIRKFN
jgi:2-iminoacetate synthase ThiH